MKGFDFALYLVQIHEASSLKDIDWEGFKGVYKRFIDAVTSSNLFSLTNFYSTFEEGGLRESGKTFLNVQKNIQIQARMENQISKGESDILQLGSEFVPMLHAYFKETRGERPETLRMIDKKLAEAIKKEFPEANFEEDYPLPNPVTNYKDALTMGKQLLDLNRQFLEKVDMHEKITGKPYAKYYLEFELDFISADRKYDMDLMKAMVYNEFLKHTKDKQVLNKKLGIKCYSLWNDYYKKLPDNTNYVHTM